MPNIQKLTSGCQVAQLLENIEILSSTPLDERTHEKLE